eukprot:jgi/Orpsp1_1/1192063/evm.model.d7180000090271.1
MMVLQLLFTLTLILVVALKEIVVEVANCLLILMLNQNKILLNLNHHYQLMHQCYQ